MSVWEDTIEINTVIRKAAVEGGLKAMYEGDFNQETQSQSAGPNNQKTQ
jgi:hypothetical protein